MDPSFRKKLYLGTGISAALLLIVSLASFLSLHQLISRSIWVNHTNDILLSLENIISGLKDAETGQRGYLITQNPEYLEPYIGSYSLVFSEYKKVKRLTLDNQNQQYRLDTLHNLINNRFKIINEIVGKEKDGNHKLAISLVIEGRGKKTMDSIRVLVNKMKAEEVNLRNVRFEKVKSSSFISPILVLSGTLITLVVCIIFFIILKRDGSRRFEAEEQLNLVHARLEESYEELKSREETLQKVNHHLEDLVNERTIEIKKRINELERINSDLDNFVYSASHDIKAPVVNIEALTSALRQELRSDENELILKMLRMIEASLEKLTVTVSQLEKVSMIKLRQKIEIINIEDLIDEIAASLANQIIKNNATINKQLSVTRLRFSKFHLSTILSNLISNSLKFRSKEKSPEIEIITSKSQKYILITVRDNGIGFDITQMKKVFGLFRRAHDMEGTGAGLYIVKRIVEESGGKLEVNSIPGTGTTFFIYLPDL